MSMRSDWIMGIGILLMLGAHMSTSYIINIHATAAKNMEDAKKISLLMEANPISRFVMSIKNFNYIWSYVLLPVLTFNVYYYFRRKYKETDYALLESIAWIFFSITLLDFLNDISIMLAYIK